MPQGFTIAQNSGQRKEGSIRSGTTTMNEVDFVKLPSKKPEFRFSFSHTCPSMLLKKRATKMPISLASALALFLTTMLTFLTASTPEALAQTSSVAPKPSASPAKPVVKPSATPAFVPEPSKKFPKVVSKLMVEDLQNGRGRTAKPSSKLVVHFTSWLYDPTQPLGRGPQFESTQGKSPYKFQLQNPETPHIKGWEQGLVDMRVGGRRRLIIPPDMGYGENGAGQTIPPGATLLYEIELVDVE